MDNKNSLDNQRSISSRESLNNYSKFKPKFGHKHGVWRCFTCSDISYINKYKPKMLQSISITNLRSENIGETGLRNIRKALTSSKRISSIIFESPEINAKQLSHLLDSTNRWRQFLLFGLKGSERMDRELIKTLPRLGRCKNLTDFPLPIHLIEQHVPGKTVKSFCQQLRGLNKLQSLSIDIPLWNRLMILDYKPPRSITYLYFGFENNTHFSQSHLSTFLLNVQKCNQLQSLSIRFGRDFLMEPSDAQIWTSFFQNPPHLLQSLQLYLDFDATQQQSEGVQIFMESLKHLKTLTILKLDSQVFSTNFGQSVNFLQALFSSLLTSLQCLTQLETLMLSLPSFLNLKKSDIQNLNSTLKCLNNLKNLTFHLNIRSIESPDESLVEIADSLKQLMNLQTLDLLFVPKTPFNYESVRTFSKSISHLPLTSLNLCFGSSYGRIKPTFDFSAIMSGFGKIVGLFKTNEKPSLTLFFSDLSQFSSLSNLKLGLSTFQISPREFRHLSLALTNLKNISSLQLDLPQFDPKNDFEGLRNLVSCLGDMKKLTTLNLIFEGKISNQEVGILSSSLVNCQSVRSLRLNFQKASQLQDESLYFLLGALRSLLKLKNLSLMFLKIDIMDLLLNQNQEAFGEQATSHFLQGLTVLRNLQALYFIFNPLSVTQYHHALLPENLKGYENLRQLTLLIAGNFRFI